MTKNIEGKHLRWFITGAVAEYWTKAMRRSDVGGEDFNSFVSDTCNKVHKYLTGTFSTSGNWHDLQCSIVLEIQQVYGLRAGDNVEIFW